MGYLIQNMCLAYTKVSKTPYIPKIWNSSPASRTKNGYPKGYPFLFIYGLEPIYMQVSGGRLLSPVQKLVTTSIFLSCGGKEKCKSSPASRTKETVERRSRLGICTLQIGSFPTILHQKATAGVSLAVAFYLVLQENLSFWSASQF